MANHNLLFDPQDFTVGALHTYGRTFATPVAIEGYYDKGARITLSTMFPVRVNYGHIVTICTDVFADVTTSGAGVEFARTIDADGNFKLPTDSPRGKRRYMVLHVEDPSFEPAGDGDFDVVKGVIRLVALDPEITSIPGRTYANPTGAAPR